MKRRFAATATDAMTAIADYGWDWSAFYGSAEALKYARRDLPALDRAVSLTPRRSVAVQAGGCLGIYPKRLAQLFATVYTFEPAADLFALMFCNTPEPNIVRFQAALGFERQLVNTSRVRRDGKPNAHEGITHVSGSGPIPTLRIDDLGLSTCDFIQLDLEGWELYALRGAVETVRRCKPVVVVEINKSLNYMDVTPEQVRGYLDTLNYRFVERLGSDEVFVPCH